ncbi:MAG: NGG1p interacting factor NIF3, partial [Candidatus Schekmanbacteria bacterium]
RILYGDNKKKVKNILVGIDVEIGEILLADRLREKKIDIDLVIAHHPEGKAMANFYDVMGMQADILHKFGVPVQIAEAILEPRIGEVSRRMMPVNYNRTVDAARLLDIPLMCVHTPADNAVTGHLQKLFEKKKPRYVSDVVDILLDIPEYKESSLEQDIPKILVGNEKRRCGNIFVDMTGGTGGSKEMFQHLAKTDVGTVVGMHIGEDHRKEAEKNYINIVIAGHMASDSMGINLLLDRLVDEDKSLKIYTCSGFKRYSRLKRAN